jgi:hypothetical protein
MTVGGSPKPSFKAFAIPLAELSHVGTQTVFWGQVRPGFGRQRYRIQRAVRGRWRDVGSPRWTSSRGYFQRGVTAEPGTRFRVLAVRKRISSLSLKVR